MTLIDFYVLNADKREDQRQFACRLIDKAVKQGNRVLVSTEDEQMSKDMDELLWSYRPESFVPHAILGTDGASEMPVVISHELDDPDHHDVLVNLRAAQPKQFSRFKRLAEIVVQEQSVLEATRKNYSFYKERGYPVNTHKLKG